MSVAEIIAMVRDIVILVMLVISILVLLFVFLKISALLNSARRTLESAEDVVTTISERIVRPAASGSGTAFRLGKVAAFMSGLFGRRKRKKEEEKDDS